MGGGNLMVQNTKIIRAAPPQNYTGAAMTAYYVSLKYYGHVSMYIHTGAWAAGTAVVTVMEAINVAGGGTPQALAFTSYWTDAAVAGTLVETACVNTFTMINQANVLYVVEIDAQSLSAGYDCVTLAIASPGANNDFYSVLYQLSMPRYAQATPPSPLVD